MLLNKKLRNYGCEKSLFTGQQRIDHAADTYFDSLFHPRFWDLLDLGINCGTLILIEPVYNELVTKSGREDSLCLWAKKHESNIYHPFDPAIQQNYRKVVSFVENTPRYKQNHIDSFLAGADPWLIGWAMSQGDLVVVTDEKPDTNGNSSKPKIPTICANFNCQCIGPFEMLRTIQPIFNLHNSPF